MRTQQEDKSAGLVRIALDGFLVRQGACAPRHFRGDSEARCPFCPTQQAGEDLIPAPAHVCSSFPSFTPLGHGEHLVHLPIMNYTGGRSRYISSLSIIQRIFFFFFFFLQWDSISRDGIFPSQKLKGISIVSHLPGGL